ncbi:MAG: signal peptidase I [Firmicutes bacterium]|nr:signal peptidase I [Bacillota bacterium]
MTEFENENIEEQNLWSLEDENDNQKWMKKSKVKIIVFLTFTFLILLFNIIFHNQELFIFNLSNQTDDLLASTLVFNILSYIFIIITFIYMIFYLHFYSRRRKMDLEAQMNSFDHFKKHYNAFDLLGVIPVFLAILCFINGLFFGFATVIGPSMQPTFCQGDYVVIEHFTQDYERDDIMIFIHDDSKLIKRVIGVPGDVLMVNSNGVFINGTLVEDYFPSTILITNEIIPVGSYYVMGDNRHNSNDSRSFGLVLEEQILGEVVMRVNGGTCN